MEIRVKNSGFSPQLLWKGILAWIVTAFVMLLFSAGVISLFAMGTAAFRPFRLLILIAASFAVSFKIKQECVSSNRPIGLLCSLCLTIVLLSVGFLVASDRIRPDGILTVALGNLVGGLLGSFTAGKAKKLSYGKWRFKMKSLT